VAEPSAFAGVGPRLYALPPGVDFPAELVRGLQARLAGAPPEAMAEVELYLNTARMRRAVQEAFGNAGPGLLPRLRLVTDLDRDPRFAHLPAPVPPLRRRLELARLVARLVETQPGLAPRSAVFDLAESLAALMAEMQDEGVVPEAVAALDVGDHAAHFQKTQAFLSIVAPLIDAAGAPDTEGLRRRVALALARQWQTELPRHPVIVAGSTGSRGTTALLMQAVARLPQGAVVLPGFDFDLPAPVWAAISDALTAEDHPQFRHLRMAAMLGLTPGAIGRWSDVAPARPDMNRLISLSLRPAPVTDQWLAEGQALPDLVAATAHVTLVEAADPSAEALAVALMLREAAEDAAEIALITPDRLLARRVAAALDRWGLRPDDSAGEKLALSAPGRFLRQVAECPGERLTVVRLLALLKHPLTSSGSDRGRHLLHSRDLELHLRRHGPVFPTPDSLRAWGAADRTEGAAAWAGWLAAVLERLAGPDPRALAAHVEDHLSLAETLAAGPDREPDRGPDREPEGGAGGLWDGDAGAEALAMMTGLAREAGHGGAMSPRDYVLLLASVMDGHEVRQTVRADPLIRFSGPREAREARAPRVILGGLSDGTWPKLAEPDAWLNRAMRQAAGLTLPERQVGLSAHDYQQAVAAPQVVLSRALRDAEAETAPSRWLNRLCNLMGGLPARGGPAALAAMRARGQVWLDRAAALDAPAARVAPAARPSPRPPVAARPAELPVTGIRNLIRDPYHVYARHILRLYPLRPLLPEPDALARGTVLHAILDSFIRARGAEPGADAAALLMHVADRVLAEEVPWPAARILWRARLARAAPAFLAREAAEEGAPVVIEERGSVALPGLGFTLTAKPDRIDRLPDGRLHILDYKSGSVPTRPQQEHFEKQLLLEAAMAERGSFARIGPAEVARITYVGLDAEGSTLATEITPAVTLGAWDGLCRLIGHYRQRSRGYTARRAVEFAAEAGDYDHLSRFGEWDMADPPRPEDVG
jgi:double-strand break repair protein AddB